MSVEVKLELGHKAVLREKKTVEGFTHDWTVFVKGCEGSNIFHFVDKVVFHLHDSFPKPKRVVKEPPYQVSESGYAGFIMPIEVYFRSKEEPKKVRFEYDLYLRLEGEPVHNIRLEKLTFQNPSEDFRRKLLKARSDRSQSGISGPAGLPTLVVAPAQPQPQQPPQVTATAVVVAAATEEPRLPALQHKATPAIAEKKPKSHTSAKESLHSNHQKQNKVSQPTANIARKEPKPISKENPPPPPSSGDAKPKSTPKVEKEKVAGKRPHAVASDTPTPQPRTSVDKKRKYNVSSSAGDLKSSDNTSKPRGDLKKEKHKAKTPEAKPDRHKNGKSPGLNNNNHKVIEDQQDSGSIRVSESSSDSPSNDPSVSPSDSFHDAMSPDLEDELLSPMTSDDDVDDEDEDNDSTKGKSVSKLEAKPKKSATKRHEQNGSCKEPCSPATTMVYRQELVELQTRIMELADHQQLQRVVDLIEQTGKYQISTKSFDFDLCSLDQATILQLKGYVKMS